MAVEIRVPPLGESVVEATIGRWLKRAGDPVSVGEPVAELETDKVNVEVVAEQAGVIERVDRKEGETVVEGDVLGAISSDGAPAPPAEPREAPQAAAPPAEPPPPSEADRLNATPVARQLAEQHGIDLSTVVPTGTGSRITKEDVANAIERKRQEPETATTLSEQAAEATRRLLGGAPVTPAAAAAPQSAAPPAPAQPGERETIIPMSRLRQTIAARLKEALNTAAMLTTFNEVDMTAVMELRRKRKEAFQKRFGVGLGFMSFFCKAVVAALKEFPNLNAEIRGTDIIQKQYYDIGIAVSTEKGLVVPVIRDADRKSFAEIEQAVLELAGRAREGKLTIPDLQGGTFTITNGGVFGSLLSTPILNTPQVGILGMHKIEERPVVVEGQIVVRPMMYLALSYDHRIVDGAEAVRFLVRVKELIEDPALLLIEG